MTTTTVTETARWRMQLWVRQSWHCFKERRFRLALICLREAINAARSDDRVIRWEEPCPARP